MTKRRTKIVNVTLHEEEIIFQTWNFTDLILHLHSSTSSPIELAAKMGLLKNERECTFCKHPLLLFKRSQRRENLIWKCTKCKVYLAIRADSIFEGSHLQISEIFKLIYLWSQETPQNKITSEVKLNKNTVVSWCLKFRELCIDEIEEEGNLLGGIDEEGNSIDVEIDESLFFKRKYNRGRLGNPMWVFGAIERSSGRCFFVPVEQRDSLTLNEIINSRIRPGSRIISDMWKAYNSIQRNPNYIHATVNHSINFVSPDDPSVHTQSIECLWSHLKRKLRCQYGTNEDLFESYLFEFIWRKRVKINNLNPFNSFLILLKKKVF